MGIRGRLAAYAAALFATLVLFLSSAPVEAQGGAELARSTLSRIPQAALSGASESIVIGVGNGDAVRWPAVRGAQIGVNPNTPNLFSAIRSASPLQMRVWQEFTDDEVREASGMNPSDWITTFEVASGDIRLGGMEIHPDSSMRLRGNLFGNGFEMDERGGVTVMWRGDADYEAAEARVDPANPFGGDRGLSTRFAIYDDRMLWATGWPTLDAAMAPSGASLAAMPEVEALLSGLARAGNLGVAASVRIWLRNGGTLPIANADAAALEGLLLSDAAARENEGAALVLLFAPGTELDGLDTRLAEAWPILHAGRVAEAPSITLSPGAQPTVTIALNGGWGEDGAATNGAYDTLVSALEGGRLGFLLSQ